LGYIGYGEAIGLACAFIWALNGLIMRHYVAAFPPALLNALRCGAAGLLAWLLMPFQPPLATFLQVTSFEWVLLVTSVLLAVGVGDTLYMVALREIGVARALAISGTFPLPTLFFEWLLLDKGFAQTFVIGCVLVVAGVALLSSREQTGRPRDVSSPAQAVPSRRRLSATLGLATALGASVSWGLGTLMTTRAIAQLTAVQANSVRLPLVAAFLLLALRATGYSPRGRVGSRPLLILALSGIIGMGVGSFLFLEALREIGAAKTTTLSSASPVFGLFLAMAVFGEKADLRTVAGILLCIVGIWLVL